MIRRLYDLPATPAPECTDRLVVNDLVGRDGHDRIVTIVFTDEQIAYLDARMAAVRHSRPLGRVGGSHLCDTAPEGRRVR
jgi:hypothetical protein